MRRLKGITTSFWDYFDFDTFKSKFDTALGTSTSYESTEGSFFIVNVDEVALERFMHISTTAELITLESDKDGKSITSLKFNGVPTRWYFSPRNLDIVNRTTDIATFYINSDEASVYTMTIFCEQQVSKITFRRHKIKDI